ncbi:MAG: amino acid ABC transporter permease [Deltaproteobacteria bacterium]|nr:amino acid ABC transporter permease [Deltaproteobacteria bacterium]MBW2122432.1 amino acid ABC transporter permease [Deltaproteobacteria bacterium]
MDYVFHFRSIWVNKHLFLSGALTTLQIALLGITIGIILGTIGAVSRNSKNGAARFLSSWYVEIIRNTPLLVQLYLWYFGLGALHVDLSPFLCVIIALGVNNGGYLTEIIRAGIEAIKEEQRRAGISLGMSRLQVFRYVVIVPSMGIVFPALCNQFVISILASALAMIIGVRDLTYEAVYLQAHTFRSIETYIVVVIIYIVLSKGVVLLSDFLDRRIFKYKYV